MWEQKEAKTCNVGEERKKNKERIWLSRAKETKGKSQEI